MVNTLTLFDCIVLVDVVYVLDHMKDQGSQNVIYVKFTNVLSMSRAKIFSIDPNTGTIAKYVLSIETLVLVLLSYF